MGELAPYSSGELCRTFTALTVQAGVQNILKDTWAGRLYGEAIVSVLPVMKSVERNEAAHLGF